MGDLRTLNWNLGWKIDANPIENADKKTDELDKKVKSLDKDIEKSSKTGASGFGNVGNSVKKVKNDVENTSKASVLGFSNIGTGIKKVVGLAAGFGTGFGLIKLGEDAIKAGDSTYMLSQKMGISATEASNLNRVLSLTDTDSKPFISSMMKLDKSIETVGVHGNATTKQLSEFGVNLLDAHGKLLPMNDQLGQLAKGYETAEKAGNGEAYATSIFGAKAQQMIPLLEDYTDAKEAASRVKGIGIDPKAAHEATINLKTLGIETKQVGLTVSNAFMPVIQTVLPYLVDGFTNVSSFIGSHQKDIQGFAKGFSDFGVEVGKTLMPIITGGLIPVFRNDVIPIFKNDIIPIFKTGIVPMFKNDVVPIFKSFANFVSDSMPQVRGSIKAMYDFVKPSFDNLVSVVKTDVIPIVKGIWDTVQLAMPNIKATFEVAFLGVGLALKGAMDIISDFIKIAKGIYDIIKPPLDLVIGIFDKVSDGIEKAVGWLINWNGTKVSDKNVKVNTTQVGSHIDSKAGLSIGQNANGTDYWRGGLTWVGERGPELVNLPRGSQVIPNNKSKDLIKSKVGYASGTDNATKGFHLVGENGPELMGFKGGETVVNNSTTQQVLNKVSDKSSDTHLQNQQPASDPPFSPTIIVNVDGSSGSNNDLAQKIKKVVKDVLHDAIEDYHQSLLTKTPLAVER